MLLGKQTEKIALRNHQKLPSFGVMSSAPSVSFIKNIIEQMVSQGMLVRDQEFMTLHVTDRGRALLEGRRTIVLAKPQSGTRTKAITKKRSRRMEEESAGYNTVLFEALRKKRAEIAHRKGKPAYVIFHDRTLREMATYQPITEESMLSISGVGEKKHETYGTIFLDIIREHCKKIVSR